MRTFSLMRGSDWEGNLNFSVGEDWWDGQILMPDGSGIDSRGILYLVTSHWAASMLGSGKGEPIPANNSWHRKKCLVIGSPMLEIKLLAGNYWSITHVDIRKPPRVIGHFCKGDVTCLPFARNEYFDAVSSNCCLCHAGLGRYGDRMVTNGDELGLSEIARVLKKGGRAAITFGPAMPGLKESVILNGVHRIYQPEDAAASAAKFGLRCVGAALYLGGKWLSEEKIEERKKLDPTRDLTEVCYLSMLLEKA
jgi:SAM-dependent methyltransferase